MDILGILEGHFQCSMRLLHTFQVDWHILLDKYKVIYALEEHHILKWRTGEGTGKGSTD